MTDAESKQSLIQKIIKEWNCLRPATQDEANFWCGDDGLDDFSRIVPFIADKNIQEVDWGSMEFHEPYAIGDINDHEVKLFYFGSLILYLLSNPDRREEEFDFLEMTFDSLFEEFSNASLPSAMRSCITEAHRIETNIRVVEWNSRFA